MMLLIFQKGESTTNRAVDANPANWDGHPTEVALPWQPINSDYNATHYKLVDGALVYDPPAAPEPGPPPPDPLGFLAAINTDALVTANNFALAFQMSPLLALFQADMAGSNLPALQAHWAAAKLNFGETWLSAEVIAMIENYAVAFRIPLIAA